MFGRGAAYYIASRNDRRFHDDFYAHLIEQLGLRRALDTRLPDGVTAVRRGEDEKQFVFLIGFNRGPVTVDLGRKSYRDVLSGQRITGKIRLPRYSGKVLEPLPQPVRAARTKRRRKLLSSRWST